MFGLGKAAIKTVLIGTHLSLLTFILSIECELALTEDVLLSRSIALASRQESHTCCFGDAPAEAASLHIGTLRSIMLPQASLEGVDIFDSLATVNGETSFIETYIAIAACAVRVVLYSTRV